jgi:hypothetical protein
VPNSTIGLNSPQEFLQHVVDPDMAAFAGSGAELRLAFHACNSLFALRDWVFQSHKGEAWSFRSRPFQAISSKRSFLEDLRAIESNFGIVADIANASKHMVLDGRAMTDLSGSANVHIQTHGGSGLLGFGALGGGAIGSVPTSRVIVQDGSNFWDVLPCAQTVHGVWKELFVENDW